MTSTPEHIARVMEHQRIAYLFSCSLEELFEIYQTTGIEDDNDTTWMRLIYSIGQWRFGPSPWSNRHIEYFKERARQNAELGIGASPIKPTKREAGAKPLSLADLGL